MSTQEDKINDTIVQMITNLKPRLTPEFRNFELDESLKRPLNNSNSSLDGETPAKKIKPQLKTDMRYIYSPRESRRLKADLTEARNIILNLENRIKHMHSVRKEMEIMFDKETCGLRQQHEYDRKKIDELESLLESVREREAETKEKLSEVVRTNIFFSTVVYNF